MKTPISSYTALAFLVTRVIQAAPTDLSYEEVFAASRDGRLITLLARRYSRLVNWTWVTQASAIHLEQMESALRDAAAGYEGRMGKPTACLSGLCLVMTIIIEAIQQQYHTAVTPPAPNADTFLGFNG